MLNIAEYKPRVADKLLEEKLLGAGAVLIEGPKWCGKTTTAERVAKSVLYINENKAANQQLAETDPTVLLEGDTPRLLDEWQLTPELWDAVRFQVDHRAVRLGQFILTGSAVPASTENIAHSGVGRFTRLHMRTMSLYESGESGGEVSLAALFNKEPIRATNKLGLRELAFVVSRGGWPMATDMQDKIALEQAYNYIDLVTGNDISRVDNVRRNSNTAKRLLVSYARGQGTQTKIEHICDDLSANDDTEITKKTIAGYLEALRKIFVIEDVPAWNPNLRSKTAIRTSDTRYFTDPSIAVAALKTGPSELIKPQNLALFGQLFETLCIRDLRIYAESLGGEVYHYRDKNDLECDAVIHVRNGQYALAEIKLGGHTAIDQAAETLKKLRNKIDTDMMSEPSFLVIISGTEPYAYRRKDGIYVVPIGCLKN